MLIACISIPALEKYTSAEIKEMIGKDSNISDSIVEFEADSYEEIAKVCYMGRTSKKVLLMLDKKKFTDIFETKIDLPDKLPISGDFRTFKVKCERIGSHDFKSQDIEPFLGEFVIEKYGLKVELENPDLIFYAFIHGENIYLGIDLSGFDLSKRDYKIMNNPFSIKGSLAFSLLLHSGYKKGDVLLDPLTKSGEIIIEAASFLVGKSIHHYRKEEYIFRKYNEFNTIDLCKFDKIDDIKQSNIYAYTDTPKYVNAAKKNAKILDLNKYINFSRVELEWLDFKFEENSVDKVVTIFYKSSIDAKFEKNVAKFFQRVNDFLKKDGIIVILTRTPEYFADDKYKIIERIELEQPDRNTILKFSRA